MNTWLDKKAYNDARYGPRGFPPATAVGKPAGWQKSRPEFGSFRNGVAIVRHAPSLIVIILSMIYGGYYAAVTHADCNEVARQSFKLAFAQITQLGGEFARAIGIGDSALVGFVVEFIAGAVSLIFALFSSLGGLIVYLLQASLHH